jgi:hypothetical protein
MASNNGIIFPESMADFLANPIDICFGSMPATSTALVAYLVIKGNTVTTNQQIETDLSKKADKFVWDDEAQKAFEAVKESLTTPPVMTPPLPKETLLLYISDTTNVVSTVLVAEREE